MKIGGQIPWNGFPICETFKISCLMGNLHTRDALGNHLMDRWKKCKVEGEAKMVK